MSIKYSRSEAKGAAREHLRGVITAPCNPVSADGSLNEAGLRHDLRHCVDVIGSSGLYINGFYGHFWLMSDGERRLAIEIAVDEVGGAVPIICRVAHPSPTAAIALARHAESVGADFLSLVIPQFGGADERIVIEYVSMVAEATQLGITLFNTRQVGYSLTPELMAQLAAIPNVCALKNHMPKEHTQRVRQLVGDTIVVVDPEEENLLENMLEHGQQAIYTGTNMMFDTAAAQPMRDYVAAALDNRPADATKIHDSMEAARALHRKWILEPWERTGLCPIHAVKCWVGELGMTGGPVPRPLPSLSESQQIELSQELSVAGLTPTS
jgi:4-hydroxy-tetrahydrodipicolinate synthase